MRAANEVIVGALGGLLTFVVLAYAGALVTDQTKTVWTSEQFLRVHDDYAAQCGGLIIPSTLTPTALGTPRVPKDIQTTPANTAFACKVKRYNED